MARVFIVWDSSLEAVGATARTLREEPDLANGHIVSILGTTGDRAIGELEEQIFEEIDASDGMLAFIDRPNANMAWEVGFGLGRGRPVALATQRLKAPEWIEDTPFSSMLRQTNGSDYRVMVSLIDALVARRHPEIQHPVAGNVTLLLCPDEADGTMFRALMEKKAKDFGVWLDCGGWKLSDLPLKLAGVGRVAWVLPPAREDQEGHGTPTTVFALVAAYAVARDVPVGIFRQLKSSVPADIRWRPTPYTTHHDLLDKLKSWAETTSPLGTTAQRKDPKHLLRLWASYLVTAHAKAVPLLRGAQEAALDAVFVQVDVGRRGAHAPSAPTTLELVIRGQLESLDPVARWLVVAPPGAGKTTLARHLTHALAKSASAQDDAILPVYLRLGDLPDHADLLGLVDQRGDLGRDVAPEGALRSALEAVRSVRGRLWLFLDGLDEAQDLTATAAWLEALGKDGAWANAVIVVLSREQGDDALSQTGFRRLVVLPLDPERQHQLIHNLRKAELIDAESADAVDGLIDRRGLPPSLLANPLLLSLVALTAGQRSARGDRPRVNRNVVLDQAITLLLARSYRAPGAEPVGGAARPDLMRKLLVPLALYWHKEGGERWSDERLEAGLEQALATLRTEDPEAGAEVDQLWPGGARDLKLDLDRHAGVLGRFDGPRSEWGWLHRSLRERLVAEAVAGWDAGRRAAFVAEITAVDPEIEKEEPRHLGRRAAEIERYKPWGDALGLLIGLLPVEALALLDGLLRRVPAAAVRALVAAEGLKPWQHLSLLQRAFHATNPPYPAFDSDDVDAVVELLRARGDSAPELWRAVSNERTTAELGLLWYVLQRLEGRTDADRFFDACARPRSKAPTVDAIRVDGERLLFQMGSDVAPYDEERPRHTVRISRPFSLGRAPVTLAQFHAFDAGHVCDGTGNHPVADVDWFTAGLFAAWVGGRLPTEAEWECCARAGTTTTWSFGDDRSKLEQHAWTLANSGRKTHPVGTRKANPWGFVGLYGNVWEWCDCRWVRRYEAGAEAVDAVGPDFGGGRVIRGGSAWDSAVYCRSAVRSGYRPSVWDVNVGFRVAFP